MKKNKNEGASPTSIEGCCFSTSNVNPTKGWFIEYVVALQAVERGSGKVAEARRGDSSLTGMGGHLSFCSHGCNLLTSNLDKKSVGLAEAISGPWPLMTNGSSQRSGEISAMCFCGSI